MYFEITKQLLDEQLSAIEAQLQEIKTIPPTNSPWRITDNFFELKAHLQKATTFNHLIIAQLNLFKNLILKGKINQYRNYHESDLKLTRSLFDSFYQHLDLSINASSSSFRMYFQTLEEQMKQIKSYIHYFPENMANNLVLPLSELSDLGLDLYQTAHMGVQYTLAQTRYVSLIARLENIAIEKGTVMR